MSGFTKETLPGTSEKNEGSVVTGIFFAGFSLFALVSYVLLLVYRQTAALWFSFAMFLVFVSSVALWSRFPKYKRDNRGKFVRVMPLRAGMRPRLGYRVSRFFLLLGTLCFCAGNSILCLFELDSRYPVVFFCLSAAVAVYLYVSAVRRERRFMRL